MRRRPMRPRRRSTSSDAASRGGTGPGRVRWRVGGACGLWVCERARYTSPPHLSLRRRHLSCWPAQAHLPNLIGCLRCETQLLLLAQLQLYVWTGR